MHYHEMCSWLRDTMHLPFRQDSLTLADGENFSIYHLPETDSQYPLK